MPFTDGNEPLTGNSVDMSKSQDHLQLLVRGKVSLGQAKALYGRDNEINQLVQAYKRSCDCIQQNVVSENPQTAPEQQQLSSRQELVLISGRSGTGKTALANTLVPVVQNDMGFFLSGKFELSGSQDPYAVFVSAFTRFIGLLLGGGSSGDSSSDPANTMTAMKTQDDERLSQIRDAVQEAAGSDGKVLTDMMPALERLIGPQEETCIMTGHEALHRFQFVFTKFCRAISSIAPLVLFLDDLQWSDQSSLDLLQSLLQPSPDTASALLIVASYRAEEVGEDEKLNLQRSFRKSPFSSHLRRCWLDQPPSWLQVSHIQLSNLDESSLNDLIAENLKLCRQSIRPLTALVHHQSGGNAFHALRYLRMLADQGVLYRDNDTQKIMWDNFNTIQPRFLLEQSADDVIREKLQALPTFYQEVLQLAACLGDEFEASKLALLVDDLTAEVTSALEVAVCEELINVMPDHGFYRFNHDRIRQATLSTIADEDELSFQIGRKLWQRLSPISLSASIYMVVNLLNKGIHRIQDNHERYKAAALNLEAGRKATSLAAFSDASRYLHQGMIFLKIGNYWKDKYELSLNLFNATADVEVCNQNFDRVKELTDEVFANARCHKDKMFCYVARINSIGQNGSVVEAMNFGLDVLRMIGEPLPSEPSNGVILAEKVKTTIALRGRSNQSLLSLPLMVDEDKMAAIHILDILVPYAFQSGSPYTILIGMKIVQMCLKYGLTKRGAVGFVTFAWFLCKDDRKRGYRIGQFALSLVALTRAREMIPRVHLSFYFLTHHWTRPIRESLEPLRETSRIGMEIGDIEYAMFSSYFHCTHALYAGVNLLQVETFSIETTNYMKKFKQENALQLVNPTLYYAQHMLGRPNSHLFWDTVQETDNKMGLTNQLSFGTEVAYMFGDYAKAEQLVNRRIALKFENMAMYGHSMNKFYHGLIAVALIRQGNHPKRNTKTAKSMLKHLEIWAKDCPENFLSKQKLLQAEIKSVSSNRLSSKAHTLYGESFELASKNGFTHEAALACERAGDYMHQYGEEGLAATYWSKAHSLYTEWGGTTKADHLRSLIDKRLRPTQAADETAPRPKIHGTA